jgi:hypothetical protein
MEYVVQNSCCSCINHPFRGVVVLCPPVPIAVGGLPDKTSEDRDGFLHVIEAHMIQPESCRHGQIVDRKPETSTVRKGAAWLLYVWTISADRSTGCWPDLHSNRQLRCDLLSKSKFVHTAC